MSPDRSKLDANVAILIPERQQPLRVRRVVYYEDAEFRQIYEAQSGRFPIQRVRIRRWRCFAPRWPRSGRQCSRE